MRHDLTPPTPRTHTALVWAARTAWWLVLGGWSLFALSWGALHVWIVPRIGEWRPQLEQLATKALGTPVQVGDIRAVSTGAVPAVELIDVRLFDHQGREALHLPLVQTALSVRSLWRGGFEQLVIDQPSLDVRRTRDGRWQVAGMDLQQVDTGGTNALADWFFDQTEFVIRNGQVRWQDESLDQAPLTLNQVDLVVRNPGRRHQLRLDATPPPEWGERLRLMGDFTEPFSLQASRRWEQWNGTVFAEFARVDLQHLRQQFSLSDAAALKVHQGQGALRLWADLARGQLSHITADTALEQVHLQLDPSLPALTVPALSGRVQARWLAQGWDLSADNLMLLTPEGTPWSVGRLALSHTVARRGVEANTQLNAERIDLEAVREVADHLPLPSALRAELGSAQPQGLLSDLQLEWRGTPWASQEMPTHWQAKGRVDGLSLAPGQLPVQATPGVLLGRPGIEGASLTFDTGPHKGQLQLSLNGGALIWPGLFDLPRIEFDRLNGQMSWQREGDRFDLRLNEWRFANADAAGEWQLHWHTGAGTARQPRWPGVLDLNARLDRADGAQVHRYLPLGIGANARRYVREAVTRGSASNARFRVKGDLARFPFAQPEDGEFRVTAAMTGVDFNYVPASVAADGAPPWPGLRGLQGEFRIHGTRLALVNVKGGVADATGLRLLQADAELDDYTRLGTVGVKLRATGPVQEMLGFVNRSPLAGMTGQVLAPARASGNSDLQLQLKLPLAQLERSQVTGQVTLPGNDIHLHPNSPVLTRTSGTVTFTERGFEVAQATTRLYGGELRWSGGVRPSAQGRPRIAFEGQGQASAEGLRTAPDLAWLSPLWAAASGSAPYQVQLAFDDAGHPDVTVNSSLQGLGVALPAPLDKPAATAMPLRVSTGPLPGAAARDQLTVSLGNATAPLLALHYERESAGRSPTDTTGAVMKVTRGALALGDTGGTTLPAQGVTARVVLSELDADAWDRWFNRTMGVAQTPGTTSQLSRDAALAYAPTQLQLNVDRLRVADRVLHNLRLDGHQAASTWRARIDAAELAGDLEYRPPEAGTRNAGRVFARLAHLKLEKSTANDVEQLLRQQPNSVPALDVVVERLELGPRVLGRLELDAVNRRTDASVGPGGGQEWRLNRFALEVPEARLSGSGNWTTVGASASSSTTADAPRRTVLNFKLDIDNAGQLLERFGMAGVVRGGKGQLGGSVGWLGSPLALDHPSLSGQLHIDVERGQFLKAEPGLAKLMGVLSLQALPRRLMLDFKDVFSEGFAFDFVRGDARIDKGVATTNNLQMKGINAAVLLEGQADIARETQDIHAVVVPELNAGTASLIASAINPAVGLGSFLAQFLLRQPLQEAATQQFHISGRWDDPQVERVARKPAPSTPSVPSQ